MSDLEEQNNTNEITIEDEPSDWELIEALNCVSLCKLFKRKDGGNIIFNKKDESFYVFNEKSGLWVGGKKEKIMNFTFSDAMIAYLNMMDEWEESDDKEEQAEIKRKKDIIFKAKKLCDGNSAVRIVKDFLPGMYRNEKDIEFNANDDLLPLKNGVWKFSEKKLVPYKKEFLFTQKIDINYNPEADITDMETAMNQWFKSAKDIIEFVQFWIGYCLTGFTTRQDSLIVWGSKACNGKSTLWGDILSKILGPFFDDVDSETFGKKKSGNNDGLVNLQGKRAGHIDEPEKDSDNGNGLKMNLFKNFTSGKGKIKASAKFLTQEGFKAKTKLIFSCNTIPDFDMSDQGVLRRINILEQNTEFVYQEQFDKMNEEEKKQVQIRNDDFVEKLLSNEEGLLKWAILGANKYIDNPKMPAPEKMNKTKEEVKEESDELGNWIQRNLVSDPTSEVALSSLKSFWRSNEMDFGQRKKGFNKMFLLECEKYGFKTNPGREQKSEEKILYCRRVLTQKEEENLRLMPKI